MMMIMTMMSLTCRKEKPIATPPIIRKLFSMNDDSLEKQPCNTQHTKDNCEIVSNIKLIFRVCIPPPLHYTA